MVNFMLWSIYPLRKNPSMHYIGCMGPRPGLAALEEKKISCCCWESNPEFSSL